MAKIAIISGDFPPNARGTGFSAYNVAKNLFHKYKHTAREEHDGVLELFTEIWPSLIEETEKTSRKSQSCSAQGLRCDLCGENYTKLFFTYYLF